MGILLQEKQKIFSFLHFVFDRLFSSEKKKRRIPSFFIAFRANHLFFQLFDPGGPSSILVSFPLDSLRIFFCHNKKERPSRSFLKRILFWPADAGQHIPPDLPGNAEHCHNIRAAADQKPNSQDPHHHRRRRKRIKQQQHTESDG